MDMQETTYTLPAEWELQKGIQLTWPHRHTDWHDILEEAFACYLSLAEEIASREPLLIVTTAEEKLRQLLKQELSEKAFANTTLISCRTNDTWARDHGVISLKDGNGHICVKDFCFNGWGLKFAANFDNQINRVLYKQGVFEGCRFVNCKDFVLEGGSIESDGAGTIMTTSQCLLAPNRNDTLTQKDIEKRLKDEFGAKKILWLNHGNLVGDDTDGHIDTIARFCPGNIIVYCKETNEEDEQYEDLCAMEEQLKLFTNAEGKPYSLTPLPVPDPVYYQGERLPATYANFLIMNNAVLYPTYSQPTKDKQAKEILQTVFPGYEIVGVECSTLIIQHGSLHCATMQFPR